MYEKLMQNLGFPDSEYLRKILEYLMDDVEARIAASLPGSIDEVAERVGMGREEVRDILERLFEKEWLPLKISGKGSISDLLEM